MDGIRKALLPYGDSASLRRGTKPPHEFGVALVLQTSLQV